MSFTPGVVRRSVASRSRGWCLTTLLLLGNGACGPAEPPLPEELAVETREEGQGLATTNGIISNGIISNGIISNGIISNGLSNAHLGSPDFDAWFAADPVRAAELMHYMVQCAVPAGQTRTYTRASTGTTYTWSGNLGLAPEWAGGQPATELEQQLVSACLAAHVNRYGVHVQVSLLGRSAVGALLSLTLSELLTFSEKEGCFFGNLFTGQGLYAGRDRERLSADRSSPRACVLRPASGSTVCAPILHVGACEDHCVRDSLGLSYASCTYNGVTYKPLTTRIRSTDIYRCGDGVCQFTEKCGDGTTANNCAADCGACAP
jgi:hypothetical protein